MTLGWPWPILRQGQIWSPMGLNGKSCSFNGKTLQKIYVFEKKLTSACCLPLYQGYIHVYDHYFQTSSSQKRLGQSKANFGEMGASIYKYGLCHMTKMAAMPVYGKNFKNLYLWNLKSYDLETWHGALGTQALQSLYRWWPWVDLGPYIYIRWVLTGPLVLWLLFLLKT